jgi:hypothetical protein
MFDFVLFSTVANQPGRVGNAFLPTGFASNGGQTMKLFAHPTRFQRGGTDEV